MKKTIFILIFITAISFFVNIYHKNVSPPGFSSDEASFGYNAYSILKTGRDEYGTLLPLRLKSFGDFKMPLYSYLSIPFIAINGLNETSTRGLNTVIAILFPILIFFFTKELFNSNKIGLLAAFLFSLTPAIQTIGRQAHESYLTTFLIITSLFLLLKIINKPNFLSQLLFFISLFILSFGYQFSRIWLGIFFILILFFTFKKIMLRRFLLIFTLIFFILLIPDIIVKPARVKNLLFFNNLGLGLQTTELQNEGGKRIIYNKITVGLKNLTSSYLNYFSPQFLVSLGDDNIRFSYPGISPITAVEYIFIFIGLYYLFRDNQKYRFLLLTCLLLSPLAGSLSWAGNSITRSLPIIVFINVICAYGFLRFRKIYLYLVIVLYLIFNFYSWDFYFNHYPLRPQAKHAWQYGNREIANYVKNNYEKFDHFYITKKNGQPYIFLLFYMSYPPTKYHKQAELSPPDEFGFGQVERFDKFDFNFKFDINLKKSVFIGYPEDFNNISINQDKITKIKTDNDEIFWIYENI